MTTSSAASDENFIKIISISVYAHSLVVGCFVLVVLSVS